jgi:ubiquinone/menaquinone biosynthesis C-methylase UbiE
VLDVASGEGYGTALLGIVAERVLGVDLSPEAVTRASGNYCSERVSFTVCDYATMPLSDASMDVVVSFKTLVHVADLRKFFCEIKRILRPDGLLVISTLNVNVHKDLATGSNPSQVRQLDAGKFCASCERALFQLSLLGQRSVIGSAIVADSSFSRRHGSVPDL